MLQASGGGFLDPARRLVIGMGELQHRELAAVRADDLHAHRQAAAPKPTGTLIAGQPDIVAGITTSIQR